MILHYGLRRYPPGLSQASHRHETASVTLLLRGGLRERSGSEDVVAAPLSIVVKPAGVLHADLFGPSESITCQIVLAPEAHDDAEIHHSLSRWRWIVGGPAVAASVEVARLITEGAPAVSIREASSEVLASLDLPRSPALPPSWLARAIQYVSDQIASGRQDIRVSDVAASAGVHPVHLARVVQTHMGSTVTGWIRRRRMQRAAELIARDARTLSDVAAAVGFADQSHMNRVFRANAGLLPGRYRDLVANAPAMEGTGNVVSVLDHRAAAT